MPDDARAQGHRVLICAPLGQDAATVAAILAERLYDAHVCRDLNEVADRFDDDTGVIVLTQEAIDSGLTSLQQRLKNQPTWSDVPFIMLTARSNGHSGPAEQMRERLLESAINAVMLERPLSVTSLVSATRSAIGARRRQFDMRDRLSELDTQYTRLDTLLANLPVGVAFVDRDRSTVITNPAFLRFAPEGSTFSSESIIDAQRASFLDQGQPLSPHQHPLARALEGDLVEDAEFRFTPNSKDGRWIRVNAVPLRDANEQIAGAIAVIVDVDEIKRAQATLAQSASRLEELVLARTAQLEQTIGQLKAAEDERQRAEESLRQSQKMEAVGQLTGGIAHDFNNMLTGILGSLDIMRRRIASGRVQDVNRFMDAATTSAKSAAALTQRLLAFSRRQALDAQPVAVNQLILNMKDLLDRAIDERIVLRIALAPDLPNAVVDPHQLESAILNLAINARDAMPVGGSLTIQTALHLMPTAESQLQGIAPGSYVVIAVCDTGVGMPPEVLRKVFEPFFTTKPLGQGTGLGLSMVYGFAKQSGGEVRLASEPDVGTTVSLYLPTTLATASANDEKAPTLSIGAGERVMVVEDDESVLLLIREVLRELNYEPVEFADPLKALPVLASTERLDLLISDVGLPGMSGRQLAEAARQTRPDLPILFITGYSENVAIRASLSSVKMSMLTKPFALDVLSVRIRQMIEDAASPLPPRS